MRRLVALAACLAVALALPAPIAGGTDPGKRRLAVYVRGNALVNQNGRRIRLLGVNRSSGEYACVQGWGIFEGPTDAASIEAMARWKIKAVRLPLNEHCWLGINGVPADYGGRRYRAAVAGYVRRLHAAGFFVILDLHWSAPGRDEATGQQPMPDLDHAPAFWKSVARTFRADRAVIFDLFNEPHGVSWQCWRDGCRMPGGWRAAGMQRLVSAVRSTGARQPVIVAGLEWANDLSSWLAYRPRDPARQLVAGLHVYNFNACAARTCWRRTVVPVARAVPVVTGELGQTGCEHAFIDEFMRWADSARVSYLGWTWNPWDCSRGPALIESWSGTPTRYGAGLRAHLVALRTRSSHG